MSQPTTFMATTDQQQRLLCSDVASQPKKKLKALRLEI